MSPMTSDINPYFSLSYFENANYAPLTCNFIAMQVNFGVLLRK
jgi:hypothetical protein